MKPRDELADKGLPRSITDVRPVGPWGGADELFPPGKELPASPARVLREAQRAGFGFGPISLVMRINHLDYEPFFMMWLYNPETQRWSYDTGFTRDRQKVTVNDAVATFREAAAYAAAKPEGAA